MHRVIGAFAVVLFTCLAAACGSASSMRSAQAKVLRLGSGATSDQSRVRGSLRCSSHAPRATSLDVATPLLVRPGAGFVELCRYSGRNGPRPLRLSRSRVIRKIALINRLIRELNSLPQPRGAYHCPMDDGSEIALLFGYRHLRPKRVIVGLTGCHFVTNGWTGRLGPSPEAARLVKQLLALAGR